MAEPVGHDEVDVDAVLADYDGWLTRQPLAARTRDAYLAQVRDFVTWLAGSEHGVRALRDPDVKRYVKTTRNLRRAIAGGVGVDSSLERLRVVHAVSCSAVSDRRSRVVPIGSSVGLRAVSGRR